MAEARRGMLPRLWGWERALSSKTFRPDTSRTRTLALRRAGSCVGFCRELGVARSLGEHVVDLGDGACLIHALDGGDLPRHAIECSFVELPLGIRLLRLGLGPV